MTVNLRAVLSKDMVDEAMPGNIRKAEHFIAFLRRFIEYLKVSRCARSTRGLHRLISDSLTSVARCRRDSAIVSGAPERNHLHRETATQVS